MGKVKLGLGNAMSVIGKGETVQLRLVNVIIAAYQYALHRALGSGSGAMTQLLISTLGDELIELLRDIGMDVMSKNLEDAIRHALEEFGIAKNVEVVKPETSKTGEEYVIRIYDSVFKDIPRFLSKIGAHYTLSPEALLTAAIVRGFLRKRDPDARVTVSVDSYEPDKPLVIRVKIVPSAKSPMKM